MDGYKHVRFVPQRGTLRAQTALGAGMAPTRWSLVRAWSSMRDITDLGFEGQEIGHEETVDFEKQLLKDLYDKCVVAHSAIDLRECRFLLDQCLDLKSETRNARVHYNTYLKACAGVRDPVAAEETVQEMEMDGIKLNDRTIGKMMKVYAAVGDYASCVRWRDRLVRDGHILDLEKLSILIDACARDDSVPASQAIAHFDEMKFVSWSTDLTILNSMVHLFSSKGDLSLAQEWFDKIEAVYDLKPDATSLTALLLAYSKAGDLATAKRIFAKISQHGTPDKVACTAMINVFMNAGKYREGRQMYVTMQRNGVEADMQTHHAVLSGLASKPDSKSVLGWLRNMERNGFKLDSACMTQAVRALVLEGKHKAALQCVRDMEQEGLIPDAQCYKLIISSYAKRGLCLETEKWVNKMKSAGFKPDLYVWSSWISAYANDNTDKKRRKSKKEIIQRNARNARQVFDMLQLDGQTPDAACYGALIVTMGAAGKLREIDELLAEMKERGLEPTENVLGGAIKGFAAANQPERCDELMHELLKINPKPHAMSFSMVIDGWARLGNIDKAKEWVEEMQERGIEPDDIIKTNMVKAARVARDFKQAREYVSEIRDRKAPISRGMWGQMLFLYMDSEDPASVVATLAEMAQLAGDPMLSESLADTVTKWCQGAFKNGLGGFSETDFKEVLESLETILTRRSAQTHGRRVL